MHKKVLTKKQIDFLPFLKKFSKDFGLVGGTAIALQLGHRQSIDFDLASPKEIDANRIRKTIMDFGKINLVIQNSGDEYSIVANALKLTFFHYPFKIKFSNKFNAIFMPDLLTLGAMKAYALGRRAKWKDYVDLYFIAKKYDSISPIIKKAKTIFKKEFNEKIFRVQLAYFKDIDYSERVILKKGFGTSDALIKKELIKYSLEDKLLPKK